ncbi:hypothetical protein GCM10025760_04270 [Microbacterium yannicii]|uniref:Spermidine/putrescine ABC transporter permease n=1 Tax=Microbacterium yannicii TaxID=671622 RepID=A0ABP9LXU8_9MICO|nr:hypothetical protein [Microbacterium yannicii]MCO5953658.1 hypothetical protein [Microbacterium yannicii]
MSLPTDPPLDELRALRERAYGRDADIQDDPQALARLRELEAQSARTSSADDTTPSAPAGATPYDSGGAGRTGGPTATGAGDDEPRRLPYGGGVTDAATLRSGIAPVGVASALDDAAAGAAVSSDLRAATSDEDAHRATNPVGLSAEAEPASRRDAGADGAALQPDPLRTDPLPTEPAAAGDSASAATGTSSRRPWWRRRRALLWAASVVAGVVVGVSATLAIQAAGAGRIATLQVDADAAWPDAFFGERPEDAQVFDEFYGLTVLVFSQTSREAGKQNCLYILVAEDSFGGGSCSSGSFAANASVQVLPRSPAELRERFPAGTSLGFVVEGSQVRVYAREPSILEPTP